MFVTIKTKDGEKLHVNADKISYISEESEDEYEVDVECADRLRYATVSKTQAKKLLNAIRSEERLNSLEHENRHLKCMLNNFITINQNYSEIADDLNLKIDMEKRKYYIRGQEYSSGMSEEEFAERIKGV